MAGKMNRWGYEKLIAEDIAYLEGMERTLEREHIIDVLKASIEHEYGPSKEDRDLFPGAFLVVDAPERNEDAEDLHGWPKDGEPADVADLTGPVLKFLKTYAETGIVPPYEGPRIGKKSRATAMDANDSLSIEGLQYHGARGRSVLHVAALVLVQLGIEQGRRIHKDDAFMRSCMRTVEGLMKKEGV